MKYLHTSSRYVALLLTFFSCINAISQNVGINNPLPAERLDVNGNINVTGTIKANGVDGTANQVLMKNNSGNLAWGDLCEYKNTIMFINSTGTWTVPAGVTKIYVEVWGAGGGGNIWGGGGGGCYIAAPFTVTPGLVVTYTLGNGGAQGSNTNAGDGGFSKAEIGSTLLALTAQGGGGAQFQNSTSGSPGSTTGFIATGVTNYVFAIAKGGEASSRGYMQFNATTYYETGTAGRGGDAGNTINTGATGSYYVYNNTGSVLIFRSLKIAAGIFPGGGGAAGIQYGATSISGGSGAGGSVVVHW
jgi:trimeric autotransporter adhesin